jgi:hypothetical protein
MQLNGVRSTKPRHSKRHTPSSTVIFRTVVMTVMDGWTPSMELSVSSTREVKLTSNSIS